LEALASGNTTFVFSLDQEEVGSIGNSGAWEGFVRYVMEETLRGREGKDYARLGFPNSLNTHLLGGMPALSADVDVAFSAAELEENDEDRINFRTAAVAGWGFFICADNTPFTRATSPLHVDKLMTLLDKKLPGQRRRSRYQVTWSPHSQDSPDQSASMSEVFDGKMPILDVGIPLISTHHPGSESINIWDLAWLKEMLTLYMIH
jgi:aspartyl aminopeptidase